MSSLPTIQEREKEQQGHDRRPLGSGGEQRRDRRRCPLVDIRGPEVGRDQRQLEGQPDQDQTEPGQQERVRGAGS